MKQIDERLFRWLYGMSPKVGTLYYAVRQPMLIVLLACLGILLAVPCGIVDGIVEGLLISKNYTIESIRTAAYRFGRYKATLKGLWEVAIIPTKKEENK